jgi:hypothetical protein
MRCLFALFLFAVCIGVPTNAVLCDIVVIFNDSTDTANSNASKPATITLKNDGQGAIDLNEWAESHRFPGINIKDNAAVLQPGQSITIDYRTPDPIEAYSLSDIQNEFFGPGTSMSESSINESDSFNLDDSLGSINSDSSVYDPQFLSSTLNPGVSSSNDNQDEDESAIAIPEPANILLFGILAFTGMAFAIWHRNSVQKANDAAKNQPAAQE